MTSLGEMATYLPVPGSFSTYATRFVDPSLGFALGWNYWFNWVITVAADVTIAAQVIQYWTPMAGIPAWVWSCIFLVIIFALNSLSVRVYGESEYWFAFNQSCNSHYLYHYWSFNDTRYYGWRICRFRDIYER